MKGMFRDVDHAIRFAFAMREIPIGKFSCLASITAGLDKDGHRVWELLPGGGPSDLTPHDMHAQAGLIWTRLFGSIVNGKRMGGVPEPLRSFVNVQYGWDRPRAVSIEYLGRKMAVQMGAEIPTVMAVDILARASCTRRGVGYMSRAKIADRHTSTAKTVRYWEDKFGEELQLLQDRLECMLMPEWSDRGLIYENVNCS